MALESNIAESAIDFHGLNQLRYAASQQDKKDETLRQVAGQFEALFVNMMLKSMRQAKLAEGIFDSSQSQMYQDMADQQLSSNLSASGGLGLQDMIVRQLGGQSAGTGKPVVPGQTYSLENVVVRPALGAQVSAQVMREIERVKPQSEQALTVASETEATLQFESPRDFVEKLWPMAQRAAEKIGVSPQVILSQAALETGWGQHVLRDANGESSHNLFNIKADASWHGEKTSVEALEYRHGKAMTETSQFRQYDSYQQSFDDYVNFLRTQPRYQEALQHTDNPETFIEMLHKAGYATDPNYADKVKRIMQGDTLAQISLEKTYG